MLRKVRPVLSIPGQAGFFRDLLDRGRVREFYKICLRTGGEKG